MLLNTQKIKLKFIEEKEFVKASLFSAITVLFNEPLTKKLLVNKIMKLM